MKNIPAMFSRLAAGLLLANLALRSAAASFVHETETEMRANGDFDGDGRPDVVVVDRASGAYRIGYQLAAGAFTWSEPRASGVEDVTGFAVGRVLDPARDALLFTSPSSNRINVLAADDPTIPGAPVGVFFQGVGPDLVVALDIGGAGNTAHDDLYIGSIWNFIADPNIETLLRNDGTTQTPLADTPFPAHVRHGNAVALKSGVDPFVVAVREGANATLVVKDVSTGAAVVETELSGFDPEIRYVAGFFSGGALNTFLVWIPGKTGFQAVPVTEPVAGTFKLGAPAAFDLGVEIDSMFVVSGGAKPRLAAIFEKGASAAVYDFDGTNPPAPIQDWTAPAGGRFTGLASIGNGDLSLFNGADGVSSGFEQWEFDGAKFQPGPSARLPGLGNAASGANVFLFQSEPFVSQNPGLLQSLNAADWTSSPSIGGAPKTIDVDVETFMDSERGLDNPTPRTVSTALASANFSLVNQYMEPISIRSFAPAVGDEVVEVRISPQPGVKRTSVTVSFTAQPAPADIFHRTSASEDWQAYAGPFTLFKTTTVSYYAKPPVGDEKSVVKHAAFVFPEGPDDLDSDEDGVPDYVEIGKGLDPLAGDDTDGDGYSDKTELIKGSDPNDASSTPVAGSRLEEQSGFDLVLTPRPYDGTLPGGTLASAGAIVRSYDLQGGLFTLGYTGNLGLAGVDDPAVMLSNITVDEKQRLVVAATEPHFDIATAGTDKRLGREMLKLVPVPGVDSIEVGYSYGGGDIAAEAANWIGAAQAADAASVRKQVAGDMTVSDTLVALLVEKKVEELLTIRGLPEGDAISLFTFRPADAERLEVARADLLELEKRIDGVTPGVRVVEIYGAIAEGVDLAASADVQALVALSTDIHRISSSLNNANPGTYRSPVDTIRAFIATGVLDEPYELETVLTAGELASAADGCAELLGLVGSRPTRTLSLYVTPSSFGPGCTTLETVGGEAKSLFFFNGAPYRFPEAFQLLVGSEVRVFAYADLGVSSCGGEGLEVISVELTAIPAPSVSDSDGDLMSDDFECAFLGGIDADPFGDADGDGISNLQESLDHTDPNDAMAAADEPFDLSPPSIGIEISADGMSVTLSWAWPEKYAGIIGFVVVVTDDLGVTFTEIAVTPAPTGEGTFAATVPLDASQQFYAFKMRLQ